MKIAIVTGASSGIGMEFVKMIDKKSSGLDEIWVIARRKERLETLQYHVHRPLRILAMDLSQKESLDQFKELLNKKRPYIRTLVLSAGYGRYGNQIDQDFDDALGMIDVNVRALTGICQSCLKYMVSGGRIIMMSSAAAFLPQPGFGIYAATKSYVLSYARSLGCELKRRGISVTAVCPGPVNTEFFGACGTGGCLRIVKNVFMAEPDRIVRLAWKDAVRRKELSVYGLPMKLFYGAARLIPHKLILKGMGMFVR